MFLLQFLAVVAAIYALLVGRALLRLRGLRFHCPETRFSGLDEISAAERTVLDVPRAWLLANGFRHVAWLGSADLIQSEGQPRPHRPEALYLSRDGRLRCVVGRAPLPFHGLPHMLRFASSLADGTELITVNRAGPLPAPPGIELADAYAASDDAHLACHRARVGEREALAFADTEALLARQNRLGAELFAWWCATALVPATDGWQLRWVDAWRFFRLVQRHQARMKAVPAPAVPAANATIPAGDVRIETEAMAAAGAMQAAAAPTAVPAAAMDHAEAAMLAQQLDIEATAGSGKAKWRSFALTAIGFLLLGKLFFGGGWSFIVALMLVLLVHELGHYLAMRAFGFRDLSIFFLPLLGAAARGHNDRAPPWQQVVVLLAGPVPGLLLGLAALAAFYGGGADGANIPPEAMGFLVECAIIALVVNGLNLLPIQPLDGGRVAELLFFSRFPRVSALFFAAGVAAFFGLAAAFSDPVLAVLGVFLALGLPYQWRLAQLARTLRPQFGVARDREAALLQLARAYNSGSGRAWPALARVNLARALLPRLQGGLPGLPTVLVGGAVYLGLIAAPLLALLSLGPQALSSPAAAIGSLASLPMASGVERRLETRLAEARTVEETAQAHLMLHLHFKHPMPGQDDPASAARAREHLDAAWALLPQDNPLRLGRAGWGVMHSYLSDLAERDPAAARQLHARLRTAIARQGSAADEARWLAEREGLLEAAAAPLAERLAHHEEMEAVWAREASLGHLLQSEPLDHEAASLRHYARSGVVMARRARALLLWEAGRGAETLPLLARNHEEMAALGGDEYRALRDHTLADLAWLHLAMGEPARVAPLFSAYTPRSDSFLEYEDDPWRSPLPEQAQAWAWLETGDAAAALARFETMADAARRADPGLQSPLLALSLALDRLLAQQRLGDNAGISRTQSEIRTIMKKMGDARWAASVIVPAAQDARNLAALRARAHRDLLATLGYPAAPAP